MPRFACRVVRGHFACIVDILIVCLDSGCVIPNPLYKEIGDLIRAQRKKMGMRQKNLAAFVGISRGTLANIETGRQNLHIHQLYNFARALKLRSPADLLPPSKNQEVNIGRTGLTLPKEVNIGRAGLHQPKDLKIKPSQKEQIARLFSEPLTNQKPKRNSNHAKSSDH